jgi:hypothetical protein
MNMRDLRRRSEAQTISRAEDDGDLAHAAACAQLLSGLSDCPVQCVLEYPRGSDLRDRRYYAQTFGGWPTTAKLRDALSRAETSGTICADWEIEGRPVEGARWICQRATWTDHGRPSWFRIQQISPGKIHCTVRGLTPFDY